MNKEASGIQVIARAAAILRAVGRDGVSLGDLARETKLPRSTVQRIVDALAHEHLLEAGADGVRLGWGIQALAQVAQTRITEQVRPYLESLALLTGESVDIACRDGREVTFVDHVISQQELRVVPTSEKPRPLHAMANGKALLALLDDRAACRLLGLDDADAPLVPRLTPNTLVERDGLLATLADVRRTGLAYDREEHAEGVCAVAIAIDVPGIRPHALSIAVPTSRFAMHLPRFEAAIRAAHADIVAALRHDAACPGLPARPGRSISC
ncbi:IclR family transcriptional regulator [Robbsia sp. KACC 23696]|uniref:IclR family transcriptional regulator n=1 Tax=Robbsia sp. KACC 23696 TaxID=3149231 RepID=UPI00325AFEC1